MSKLALMGRALMSTTPALNPLRRLTLTRRFSVDTGGDQTPPPPLEADQPPPQDQTPPPPVEAAAQQDQTPPPQDQAPPVAAEQPPPQDASYDPFRQGSGEGLVFGRLTGVGKNTMKTDVIHLLEGSDLSIDDVKVEYSNALNPLAMMLRFTSQSSYETAMRQIARKGRFHKLVKLDMMMGRSAWDSMWTFNGRTVLLHGLPLNASLEDIERFLSGFNFDPTSIQIKPWFNPNPNAEPMRFALVSFQSRLDAMNALTVKNRSFCRNNPITMRILH